MEPPSTSPATQCASDVAPSPLTRLTSAQYASTVRELLQIAPDVLTLRGADEKPGAFVSNSQAPLSEPTVDAYRLLAEQVATEAVGALDRFFVCDTASSGEATCAARFISELGLRAYRRPLTPEEQTRYQTLYGVGQQGAGYGDGIRLVLQAMLQSPAFLYRVETGVMPALDRAVELSDYELATRLAYLLRGSLPDADLLAAAAQGALRQPEGLRAQAERLFNAPEAEQAIASFYSQWLHLDDLSGLEKNAALFPTFDDATRQAMQRETARFANFVIRRGDGLLKTLFTAPYSFPEGPLLTIYGVSAPADPSQPVMLDSSQRAGFLTHPGVMAVSSHPDQSSPIFRGIVVREHVLCQALPPPPANVNAQPPVPDATATTRQRFAKHVAEPACAGCHKLIDPIGLGFEHYDAIGAYRTQENGAPIDASGELVSTDVDGAFDGAVELANRLAGSDEVRKCMMNQWFQYTFARGASELDSCTLERVYGSFKDSDFNVRELIFALIASDAFRLKRAF
jgi:hypothetical protein